MASDVFGKYLSEINKAYLRGDATEHTHRPALKALIEPHFGQAGPFGHLRDSKSAKHLSQVLYCWASTMRLIGLGLGVGEDIFGPFLNMS